MVWCLLTTCALHVGIPVGPSRREGGFCGQSNRVRSADAAEDMGCGFQGNAGDICRQHREGLRLLIGGKDGQRAGQHRRWSPPVYQGKVSCRTARMSVSLHALVMPFRPI